MLKKVLVLICLLMAPVLCEEDVKLVPLGDGAWLHQSYKTVEPWGKVLSQGLFIQTDHGGLLVDTAWTNAQTERLLELCQDQAGRDAQLLVVTHAHADKMGGLKGFHARGKVRSFAHPLTNVDGESRGLGQSSHALEELLELGIEGLEVYYPGPGHARDNIVVYYSPAKLLFGGCLIRPGKSRNLGNTGDADIDHWARAVSKVRDRFPQAEIVVPSHGPMGGRELLDHTIELALNHQMRSLWDRQVKALQSKDWSALAQVFSKQAQLHTLAGGRLQGRSELQTFWQDSMTRLGPQARLDWDLVERRATSADSGYFYGRWEMSEVTLPQGYPSWGYFFQLWEREGGQAKVSRAYFWGVTEGHTRGLRPPLLSE